MATRRALLVVGACAALVACAAAQAVPFTNKTSIRVCTSETTPSKRRGVPPRATRRGPSGRPAAARTGTLVCLQRGSLNLLPLLPLHFTDTRSGLLHRP